MTRRKRPEDVEINVWPSSLPEDIGAIAPPVGELSVDVDELGRRYLSEAVEQDGGIVPSPWSDVIDDEDDDFDQRAADGILRSFGLDPLSLVQRSGVHVIPPEFRRQLPSSEDDLNDLIDLDDELDLTEETTHEVSLLDHEAEEAGEVESPWLRTEDTRTHGKPRGGHARPHVRPVAFKR